MRQFLSPLAITLVALTAGAQDAPFVETPEPVVEAMLDLAQVGPEDVLYDLGSGDGRIVIAAALRGARAVGIESDPDLIVVSERKAQAAGVEARASFMHADLFAADVSPATAVALYLGDEVNRQLAPKLAAELAPGTRIVSHKYEIAGWEPEQRVKRAGRTLFLYRLPDAVERSR